MIFIICPHPAGQCCVPVLGTLLHLVTASDGGASGHELKHKAAIVMFKVGSQRCERNYAYTGVVYAQGTGSVLL